MCRQYHTKKNQGIEENKQGWNHCCGEWRMEFIRKGPRIAMQLYEVIKD
jgi:hypothetical protein